MPLPRDFRSKVKPLRTGHRARVRARNGHRVVLMFARGCRHVFLHKVLLSRLLLRARSSGRVVRSLGLFDWGDRSAVEAILLHLRGGALNTDRWRLQLEGLRLGEATRVLDRLAWCLAILGCGGRVVGADRARRLGRAPVARVSWRGLPSITRGKRGWSEAGGVGSRLRAEVCEIQVGARAVAVGHALAELALRPEAVEDNSVDDN